MKSKHGIEKLSVFEAIDALEKIVKLPNSEIQLDDEVDVSDEKSAFIKNKIKFLRNGAQDLTKESFKSVLSVVLHYLKDHYKKAPAHIVDPHAVEGIRKIMGLVGEAAKKIDLYAAQHHAQIKSSTQLREYKQLQDFYRKRVVRQIDENVLGKWVLDIGARGVKRRQESEEFAEHRSSRYLFVDLDALKHDIEYDLLFIRKEDGSHFFSPGLIRNMKLVCNFSQKLHQQVLLTEIKQWQDNCMCNGAQNILRTLEPLIHRFYRDAYRFRHREMIAGISNCLMALMLAASTQNLRNGLSTKSCRSYFYDFQYFLRELLQSDQFHHLQAHPPAGGNKVNTCAYELISGFCRGIFLNLNFFRFLAPQIQQFLQVASVEKHKGSKAGLDDLPITAQLLSDYAMAERAFKSHASGPLRKLLEAFEEDAYRAFDPLLQRNFPSQLFALQQADRQIVNLHLPSPTHQEYIHRAGVIDEFRVFLNSFGDETSRLLLINLQDRTAWKEHARSIALEEFAKANESKGHLVTVSLAKDTDFYLQAAPYNQINQFDAFLVQLKEHFGDKSSGSYFPTELEEPLRAFFDPACKAIHRMFFSSKNVLPIEMRRAFIEIFDLLLTLKLIDLVKPVSFSFTCKDGIDFGSTSSVLLYLLLKLLNAPSLSADDWSVINSILYAPAFLVRERVILHERLQRMVAAFKVMEFVYRELGEKEFAKMFREEFGSLYSQGFLQLQATV